MTRTRHRTAFLLALQFLTRLPVRVDEAPADLMAQSPRWYPAAGVVIGIIVALVQVGAALIWPPLVAAILSTATGILLTGALHEDGFADTCDGLGGGRTKERALDIMRDSRIGSYGALGLILMLAGKVAVLAALPASAAPWVLIAGHAASRGSLLWVMQVLPYARAQGAGSAVAQPLDAEGRWIAGSTVVAAMLPLLFVLPFHSVLLGLAGLTLGHIALRRRFESKLGGYTGDCLGATQQASEIGLLLGCLAFAA